MAIAAGLEAAETAKADAAAAAQAQAKRRAALAAAVVAEAEEAMDVQEEVKMEGAMDVDAAVEDAVVEDAVAEVFASMESEGDAHDCPALALAQQLGWKWRDGALTGSLDTAWNGIAAACRGF